MTLVKNCYSTTELKYQLWRGNFWKSFEIFINWFWQFDNYSLNFTHAGKPTLPGVWILCPAQHPLVSPGDLHVTIRAVVAQRSSEFISDEGACFQPIEERPWVAYFSKELTYVGCLWPYTWAEYWPAVNRTNIWPVCTVDCSTEGGLTFVFCQTGMWENQKLAGIQSVFTAYGSKRWSVSPGRGWSPCQNIIAQWADFCTNIDCVSTEICQL